MILQRGMRERLDKYININNQVEIEMNVAGSDVYDFCCFGVDIADKLTDDRYMIFYNQVNSPLNEILYQNSGNTANFKINLNSLPASIHKLVFTVSIDGKGVMSNIGDFLFGMKQNGKNVLNLKLGGPDFKQEKAVIAVEIYRKDGWRINAIARGFNGGLGDLLRSYGGQEAAKFGSNNTSILNTNGNQTNNQRLQNQSVKIPQKVNLLKGQKVSLVKVNNGLGEILINLNWRQPTGFFAVPIDLDLGCLYELKDGSKGAIQALGNLFGSLSSPPYIALDGDDRSGASAEGENLRINGAMVPMIRRILVYTFIYEGIANWQGADGVVTVKCPGSPEIIVHMDEYGSSKRMCAIAMLENINDTLSVEKIVKFFDGHRYMDQAFDWGLEWVAGRK